MRKIVVGEFLSLDGVYQGPGGPDEDRDNGFTEGGWVVPHIDDAFIQHTARMIQSADAFLLGRKTYEIFSTTWSLLDDSDPVARKFNHAPKYVASNTLTSADWENSTLLSGDIVSELKALKETEGGEIQVGGSGNLLQTLLKNDLVDEMILFIFPVVLGSGKRFFGDGAIPRSLKLVDSSTFDTGVIVATYRREGDLATGAYGVETGNYESPREV